MAAPIVSRRAFLMGTAGLALTATACGGGTEGRGGPAALRFSWWGSNERHEYTQRIVEQYEAARPGVTISPEFTGWDEYWDRLATTVAGGDAPDVMQHESRYVREYADRGALRDLTEFIPGVLDTAALDPSVLSTGQLDGATYAVPSGINARVAVIDPQVFADTGVPVPDDTTWTWDQLVDTAAQISRATGGRVHGMQDMGFNDTTFEIFARQRGQALFGADGGLGFERQTLVDFWALVVRARDTGASPPASLSVEVQAGGIDQGLLSTNRGAIGFWWTNELPTLSANAGRPLELLRMPGERAHRQPGMYFKPAMYWAVSATTEYPEEAARLIGHLVNSPDAAQLLLSDRGLPVNTQLRAQIVDRLEPADRQSAAFIEEITPEVTPPPPLPPRGAGEVQQILQQLNEQVLFGQLTVDEAADRFMSEVQAAIA